MNPDRVFVLLVFIGVAGAAYGLGVLLVWVLS